MVSIYQISENNLVLITFLDTSVRISLWLIAEEQPVRAFGRIYASETDAAARYMVECARYCGQEQQYMRSVQ